MTVTSFGQIGVEPNQVPRLERTGRAGTDQGFDRELDSSPELRSPVRSAEDRREARRAESDRSRRSEPTPEKRGSERETVRTEDTPDEVVAPAVTAPQTDEAGPARAEATSAPVSGTAQAQGPAGAAAEAAPEVSILDRFAAQPRGAGSSTVTAQSAQAVAQTTANTPVDARAPVANGEAKIAPTAATQTANKTGRTTVPAPVHAPRFVTRPEAFDAESIVRRLAVETSRGDGRIEIELDPPELGRIDVDMFIEDGRARLVVAADRPDIADAIERRLDELTRALAEQGITVDGAEVRQREQKPEDRTPTPSSASGGSAEETGQATLERRIVHRHDGSGLDLFI